MRSGSERMHMWRRTPSTGRSFQTLIIWITVSSKASCNGSISVNTFFFLDFFNFCWVFQNFPFFVSLCTNTQRLLPCANLYCYQSRAVCSSISLRPPATTLTDLLCQLSDAAAAADFPLTSTLSVATFHK